MPDSPPSTSARSSSTSTPIRVLVLEDDPVYRHLVLASLTAQSRAAGTAMVVDAVATLAEALRSLAASGIDAVIADLNLPDSTGAQTYEALVEASDLPIVVMTADTDERHILRSLSHGVMEFVAKESDQHLRLYPVVLRACERFRHRAEEHQRQHEEARRRRLMAIGTMCAGVAHEFNNLNTVVAGNVEMILRDPGLSAAARKRLNTCLDVVRRSRDLTSGMLDLVRSGGGDRVSCDLVAVVRESVELLARDLETAGVEVALALGEGPLPVLGHPSQIGQVVFNLCRNAIQAMAGRPRRHLSLGITPRGGAREMVITDTGCGIPAENLGRIFDPFFSTKGADGTGLGLAVSEAIVQRYGGEIAVASTVGVGTTFTLRFQPAGDAAPASTAASAAVVVATQAEPRSARALVVDDEVAIGELMAETLGDLGYIVTRLDSGQEAITTLAADAAYDLVLIDWTMPSVGGRDVLAAAGPALAQARAPVLIVSGLPHQVEIERPQVPGLVSAILGKPCGIADVERAVRALRQRLSAR